MGRAAGIALAKVGGIALALGLGVVGCAEQGGSVAADAEDLVSDVDLDRLARALHLARETEAEPVDAQRLAAGVCHRALVQQAPGGTTFTVRTFRNGAVFFAAGGASRALCADLHEPSISVTSRSLSGAALDAVLRYDLGGLGSITQTTNATVVWRFEHGEIVVDTRLSATERTASVHRPPHESTGPLGVVPTITGALSEIRLHEVAVLDLTDATTMRTVTLGAPLAALVHRFAARRAAETGRFALADDAAGTFLRKGSAIADDGAFFDELELTKLSAHQGTFEGDAGETFSNVFLDRPGAPLIRCVGRLGDPGVPVSYACENF
jgi:hypothetical protein